MSAVSQNVLLNEITNPNLHKFLLSMNNPSFFTEFSSILIALKRGTLAGPLPCAKATIGVLYRVINDGVFASVNEMVKIVRDVYNEMQSIVPCEFSIGNVAKRVLFYIRDDSLLGNASQSSNNSNNSSNSSNSSSNSSSSNSISSSGGGGVPKSAASLDLASPGRERRTRGASIFSDEGFSVFTDATGSYIKDAYSTNRTFEITHSEPSLKSKSVSDVRTAVVKELIDFNELEIESSYIHIRNQALDHIHNDETILVYGHNILVEKFLKQASTGLKKFSVIVSEGGAGPGPVVSSNAASMPTFMRRFDPFDVEKSQIGQDKGWGGTADAGCGYQMAMALSKLNNIAVTLVPDSNIYALMSRINKVILSPVAVMANGGAIAPSGHEMIAIAAKDYKVPIIYLAASPQITPLFPHNQTVARAMRVSPAVWSYSCNNYVGYGSSNNSNSIDSIYLKERLRELKTDLKEAKAAKSDDGDDSEDESENHLAASIASIEAISGNSSGSSGSIGELLNKNTEISVLKANSKRGVFPNNEDKLVDLYIPGLDYIEPDLIECYLTNTGCHLPSSTYRLLSENYNQKDMHQ